MDEKEKVKDSPSEEKTEETVKEETGSKSTDDTPKDSDQNTVNHKPESSQSGNVDMANMFKSFRQEIIDIIDLKFASMPVAKVEPEKPKEKFYPKF